MESLRRRLDAKLDVASANHNLRQSAAIARDLAAGGTGRGVGLSRMAIAASMVQERVFQTDLAQTFDPSFWSGVPHEETTFEFRCCSFRMLSRAGCCVEWYLQRQHRTPKFQIHRLLDESLTAEELGAIRAHVKLCPDLWDSWLAWLVSRFPDLTGPEFEATCETEASILRTDTVPEETGFSAIRRSLYSRVQRKVLCLADLHAFVSAKTRQKRRMRAVDRPVIGNFASKAFYADFVSIDD